MDQSPHRHGTELQSGRFVLDPARVHNQSYLFSPLGICLGRTSKIHIPPSQATVFLDRLQFEMAKQMSYDHSFLTWKDTQALIALARHAVELEREACCIHLLDDGECSTCAAKDRYQATVSKLPEVGE